MKPILLIIDDEKLIRQSLGYFFAGKGYEVHEAETAESGMMLASELVPDLVVLDYRLPDKTGMEALSSLKSVFPDMTVIMLTAFGNIPDAVEAIRLGAFDYLTKPVDLRVLEIAAERAASIQALKKENWLLRSLPPPAKKEGLVGNSAQIHKLSLMIDVLAENPQTTVLIEGESGTGKDLAARTIHNLSPRKDRPFVEVNCASLSENLLESELFGHERGAFTDAKQMKKGLLEIADGGVLFLDEIGELAQGLQPKLLKVIENKTFRRVGGTRDITVDVRIMAATNRNLKEAVARKSFREDLYYRLRVMPITMPPLRERKEDILVLARHFITGMCRGLKKNITGISPECERCLLAYNWPGNIRELKNVMERAIILSPGPMIDKAHLPSELTRAGASGEREPISPGTLEEAAKDHIVKVLEHSSFNHSKAARILGISRSTLIGKLKKFGLV